MQQSRSQLYSIITVFFFWGFIAASNGIFIPFCKGHFSLSQFESQLIDFTFYIGYFVGSLSLFGYTAITRSDLLNRIGLKRGIVYGLLTSALGALLIIPSVQAGSYAMILGAYFVIALGFSLQQTCAQPLVILLGSADTGSHRLNLAGAVNSLGTTIGPVILGNVLFAGGSGGSSDVSLGNISGLYVVVAALFVGLAAFFSFSAIPALKQEEQFDSAFGALRFPQLRLGMLAIFIYVGVEVTIQSNMGSLMALPAMGGYTTDQLAPFISMYWGSLMIGRWTGALAVFELKGAKKVILQFLVPVLAWLIVLGVNRINGNEIDVLWGYVVPILLMVLMNLQTGDNQAKSMIYFSLFGLVAMLVGLFTEGKTALYAFLSGGLACSVLWPCIFSMSIRGLGKYTGQASAFLILMIAGGAVIPPVQGLLADSPSIGIHGSYGITVLCFAYLVWFGWKLKPSGNVSAPAQA